MSTTYTAQRPMYLHGCTVGDDKLARRHVAEGDEVVDEDLARRGFNVAGLIRSGVIVEKKGGTKKAASKKED